MIITRVQDICYENINWGGLGSRFKEFREAHNISRLEAAQEIDLTEPIIARFEEGYSDRKATNIIWNVSLKWDLSMNWLLNGAGKPHDPDPVSLMPETLHVQKGAGIRRNQNRLIAEEGRYSDYVLEFVIAIDKFKRKHKVPFPSLTQIYEIIIALGYRKSVPSRIAPLGYIIEHQQWAEKLNHMNEKIEARTYNKFHESISETTIEKLQPSKIKKDAKKFMLTDPEGRQYIVDDLPQFCRDNHLLPAYMHSVVNGQRRQHKGWRAEAADSAKKPVEMSSESILERIKLGLPK